MLWYTGECTGFGGVLGCGEDIEDTGGGKTGMGVIEGIGGIRDVGGMGCKGVMGDVGDVGDTGDIGDIDAVEE